MKLISMALIIVNFLIIALWLFAISVNLLPEKIQASDFPDLNEAVLQSLWAIKIKGFQEGYSIALTYLGLLSLVAVLNIIFLLKINQDK